MGSGRNFEKEYKMMNDPVGYQIFDAATKEWTFIYRTKDAANDAANKIRPVYSVLFAPQPVQIAEDGWGEIKPSELPLDIIRDCMNAHAAIQEGSLIDQCFKQIRNRISSLSSVTEEKWEPIETAPKDGTKFVGYSPTHGVRRNVSFNERRQDFDVEWSSLKRDWTHWRVQKELNPPEREE